MCLGSLVGLCSSRIFHGQAVSLLVQVEGFPAQRRGRIGILFKSLRLYLHSAYHMTGHEIALPFGFREESDTLIGQSYRHDVLV